MHIIVAKGPVTESPRALYICIVQAFRVEYSTNGRLHPCDGVAWPALFRTTYNNDATSEFEPRLAGPGARARRRCCSYYRNSAARKRSRSSTTLVTSSSLYSLNFP